MTDMFSIRSAASIWLVRKRPKRADVGPNRNLWADISLLHTTTLLASEWRGAAIPLYLKEHSLGDKGKLTTG